MLPAWGFVMIALAALSPPSPPQGAEEAGLKEKAFALYEEGRVEEAIPIFEECLRLHPGDVPVLETLAYVRYRAEDFLRARRLFETLLQTGAGRTYALFMLGNIAFREFKLGESLRFYKEAASHEPDYPSLEDNIALLREKIGRVEELKRLRRRCDVFYYGALILGAVLLGLIAAGETSRRTGA